MDSRRLKATTAWTDPSKTFDELERRADLALISFTVSVTVLTDWGDFVDLMFRFITHLDMHLLRLSSPVHCPTAIAWGKCMEIFKQLFGSGAEKAAWETVRTGKEGGLHALLKRFAYQLAENYATAEIRAKILSFWNSLTAAEKIAAGEQFITDYGSLLPQELTEGSGARILADLPKFLENYCQMVRRLRQTGQARVEPNPSPSYSRTRFPRA